MSLVQQISDLALRIASQNKQLATWINGNAADLGSLNTVSKANLVAAINEVKTTADNASTEGGAKTLGELTDVTLTTPSTGHILRHNGSRFVNVNGVTFYELAGAAAAAQAASQPLDPDLTAIAALSTTTYGRNLLALADQAALMNLVSAATEAVQGKVELATTTEVAAGTDDSRAITPLKLQQRLAGYAQPLDTDLTAIAALATTPFGRGLLTLAGSGDLTGLVTQASDAAPGKVELATTAEATAGNDTVRAVTPAGLKAVADGKANVSALAAVAFSGNAGDLTGTLPSSVLPPLAINETFTVATQAAMLALNAQRGDMALRTDMDPQRFFILTSDSPGTLADWKEVTSAGSVLSVAGKTGSVVLVKADVGLGNVDNTSDASKPISTAQQAALNTKAPLANPSFTGTVSGVTKAHVGLGNVDNTSDANKPVSSATQAAINGRQPLDATLTALAGLTTGANQLIYATGGDAFSTTPLTAFGRSLLDDADATSGRNTLEVYSRAEIGNPETDFVAVFEAGLV